VVVNGSSEASYMWCESRCVCPKNSKELRIRLEEVPRSFAAEERQKRPKLQTNVCADIHESTGVGKQRTTKSNRRGLVEPFGWVTEEIDSAGLNRDPDDGTLKGEICRQFVGGIIIGNVEPDTRDAFKERPFPPRRHFGKPFQDVAAMGYQPPGDFH
jgi:hypothetical protein